MTKYLYGASVQGIQGFIFQTNKLAEIVGASELVEEICTTKFWEMARINKEDPNIILNAAGNIKYIFEDRDKCHEFVRQFPKAVMEMAPGITISQAVVEYEEGKLNESLQKLEEKLREQRNKVSIPFEVGFMGTERARRTGGVGFINREKRNKDIEVIDEATHLKRQQSDPYYTYKIKEQTNNLFTKVSGIKIEDLDFKTDLAFNIDKITETGNNSWIAVIHVDGNGLGKIIQNLNKELEGQSDKEVQEAFQTFSKKIEQSTKEAAQEAFKAVVEKEKRKGKTYPIRPVVLGGDDLTVIIRADLALDFTKTFLERFEDSTCTHFKFLENHGIMDFKNGITACAGIAFVQKSYPFHYAIDLAEKLCVEAKNFVKDEKKFKFKFVPKSALSFFKVQDSYIESRLEDIRERVLNADGLSFDYGPYLINPHNDYAHVGELTEKLEVINNYAKESEKDKANGVSKLRQWTTEVFKDKSSSDFMLNRMRSVNNKFIDNIEKSGPIIKEDKSNIFDVIQLHSFKK